MWGTGKVNATRGVGEVHAPHTEGGASTRTSYNSSYRTTAAVPQAAILNKYYFPGTIKHAGGSRARDQKHD